MFRFEATSYRQMMTLAIGPLLNYFGFHINNDGIIQQNGGSTSITLSGKHLYVPENGEDTYKSKDSAILAVFNPFRMLEHMLIISRFFCKKLSDDCREIDDPIEYDSNGEIIDIVNLIKRGPSNKDKLPATFSGVIYELQFADGDTLGTGIDHDGNGIKAIYMAMINAVPKVAAMFGGDINFDRLFRFIYKLEEVKDLEAEIIRGKMATSNANMDLNMTSDDVEMEDDVTEEVVDDEEETEIDNNQTIIVQSDMWDEIEF